LIFIYHSNANIVAVANSQGDSLSYPVSSTIAEGLWLLAQAFRNEKLVWCHTDCKESLNVNALDTLFYHDKMMLSYRPDNSNYFGDTIGYVEESLFVNVNKKVRFPTWQMSSAVGMIHASVLIEIKDSIPFDADFDYYLCSLAKLCMPLGLLCYSEQQLLRQQQVVDMPKASVYRLFSFVKQHYKGLWIFLLLFNLVVYERKFPILPFLLSSFYRSRNNIIINLDTVVVKSSRKVVDKGTIDVIIPTIGRKSYLYDVLKAFSKQTVLPRKIIIVEQNPAEGSKSELDYLNLENWPFTIKHIFTNKSGACNARNIALDQVESEWVFFADDDILIDDKLIQKSFKQISQFGVKAVSIKCFQSGDTRMENTVFQWGSFGSGCSIVFSESLKGLKFKMGYEFGFGEDNDFGMQLRNQGQDVLYLPEPKILHLKAAVGGFRTKPVLQWYKEGIQPKPSPTIMLYMLLNNTKEQLYGYKAKLFFKYYTHQKIKNPICYWVNFRKQWNQSLFWANELKNKE
jgi:GT2 family glycosyltransferase